MIEARVAPTIAGEARRSWWGPGDMYTFLVTGEESGGSLFALDCLVGAGGGRRRTDTSPRTALRDHRGKHRVHCR